MYIEKLFKRYQPQKAQLILEPCASTITSKYLKKQRKRGLLQVQFTNNALLLATNVFIVKTNLESVSVSRDKNGQLTHVDLLDINRKIGVRITKDGLFLSNYKPEFKYISKYVQTMADHGWWLNQLMADTPLLSAGEQNKQSHNGVSLRLAKSAKPRHRRLLLKK